MLVKSLLAWGREQGLEAWEINENIEQACQPEEPLRLVVDNPEDVAVDDFPRQAKATLFCGVKVRSRHTEAISTPNSAGVGAAISALLSGVKGSIDVVHFLVPDRLLLLDAEEIRIKVNAWQTEKLGNRRVVSVHCDRTSDTRLYDFPRYYKEVTGGDFPTSYVDAWPPSGRFTEIPDRPEAVIFRMGMSSEVAPEALVYAVYMSPIVVWPAVEPEDRDRFAAALADEWPNLPAAARAARRGNAAGAHRELRHLRLVWDDPDWIELLKLYASTRRDELLKVNHALA